MKSRIVLIPLVFLLCFSSGCGNREAVGESPGADIDADVAAIKATIQEWIGLYNAGEYEKLVSLLYAEDAVLMTPNTSRREGKEAILLGYKKETESYAEHCESSVVEDVRIAGDLAVARGTDTGTSTPKSGGEPVRYSYKWLIVLERQPDGAWKWVWEIYNDNDPLPAAVRPQAQAPPNTESAEQELMKLENDWLQAFFTKDAAFSDRFLADDYLGTDEHGNFRTKAQEIEGIRAGGLLSTSGVLDNVRVRVFGDAAVATGRRIMKGLFKGKPYSSPYLWTDNFIKRDGRWQCVASHVSKPVKEQ